MDTAIPLTTDMKLVLGLVVFTMVMFLFERVRADVVALVVLVLLGLGGLVEPELLFNGFSGNAVISIIATMILGAGLDRTGALNRLAGWLLRRANGVEQRLLLYTTAVAGLNSSFMQNPSVMALYMPVASRLSSRTGLSLPRLLLPIAAAIVMGGALTMVGNSPLMLLNDLLVAANSNLPSGAATIEPLKMFAPLPIGLVLVGASLAYFHYFGDRRLRDKGRPVRELRREATGRYSAITDGFCMKEELRPATAEVSSSNRCSTPRARRSSQAARRLRAPVRSSPAPRIIVAMMLITALPEKPLNSSSVSTIPDRPSRTSTTRATTSARMRSNRNITIVKPTSPSTSFMSVVSVNAVSFTRAIPLGPASGRTTDPTCRGRVSGRGSRSGSAVAIPAAARCRADRLD